MKIALSASGKETTGMLDPRFGRCQCFIIFDSETVEYKCVENKGQLSGGGAGIAAAQQIIDEGAEAVITGNMGPNAYNLLKASGIKAVRAVNMTVEDAAKACEKGTLEEINEAVPAHSGMSGGFRGGV